MKRSAPFCFAVLLALTSCNAGRDSGTPSAADAAGGAPDSSAGTDAGSRGDSASETPNPEWPTCIILPYPCEDGDQRAGRGCFEGALADLCTCYRGEWYCDGPLNDRNTLRSCTPDERPEGDCFDDPVVGLEPVPGFPTVCREWPHWQRTALEGDPPGFESCGCLCNAPE